MDSRLYRSQFNKIEKAWVQGENPSLFYKHLRKLIYKTKESGRPSRTISFFSMFHFLYALGYKPRKFVDQEACEQCLNTLRTTRWVGSAKRTK